MGRIARVASFVALAWSVSAPAAAQPPPPTPATPAAAAAPSASGAVAPDEPVAEGGFRRNADEVAPSGRTRTTMTDEQRALYARGEAAAVHHAGAGARRVQRER